MEKHFMKHALCVIGLFLYAMSLGAVAQGYPTKPVRMVVPWPPGGGIDTVGRWLAQKLDVSLGQRVLVDNRGGQSGVIGADNVAKSPADGYTIMVHTVTGHVINAAFYGKLPYDTERDFSSITLIATAPHIIVAHPSLPVKTLKELIAFAKARPGQIDFASFGTGSTSHLSGELFNSMTGVKLVHIPYKGGGPALIDTLAGHVPLYFSGIPASLPHVKSGRLRGLAVTSAARSKQMPEIPTVDEGAGTKGYVTGLMYGVFAPAGLPREIVARLNGDLVKILNMPDIRQRLDSIAADLVASTPEQMDAYVRAELPKWAKIVKAAGIKAE
jgi:tripartite-type tricarboxylate transporter receptor subunit TctC